jgi:MFS family permease
MSSSPSPSSEKHDPSVDKALTEYGLRMGENDFVEWKDDEPRHPRNWGLGKKTYNVILVSFFEFWMTAISSAGTGASQDGGKEYHLSRTVGYLMFTSLYLFGQATGSIICSPISETFGRRTLYMVSIAVYCVACAVVAAVPSSIAVCFGRFISGAASAIPATVAFGSFDDMFDNHTRIWIVYIYTLSGNCGLVLGPIYSAYVSTYAGW